MGRRATVAAGQSRRNERISSLAWTVEGNERSKCRHRSACSRWRSANAACNSRSPCAERTPAFSVPRAGTARRYPAIPRQRNASWCRRSPPRTHRALRIQVVGSAPRGAPRQRQRGGQTDDWGNHPRKRFDCSVPTLVLSRQPAQLKPNSVSVWLRARIVGGAQSSTRFWQHGSDSTSREAALRRAIDMSPFSVVGTCAGCRCPRSYRSARPSAQITVLCLILIV
jgi:hypothetical protein